MTDLSWQHKETLEAPYDTVLLHVNADFLLMVKQGLPKYFFENKYIIGYWAWELEELPVEWLPMLDEVDEVWVPSDFVKAAVAKQANLPVVTIPHCLSLEPSQEFSRAYFDLSEDSFIFLAMFDTHSISERKNPYAAINAFKQAFAGSDNSVCLVLKVNNSSGKEESELKTAIDSHPNIKVMQQTQTRAEINSLLSNIDCYLSLHRSEGFGLGPAEAMCLGKATILTNWSGTVDFMTADNCKAIDFELVELDQDYGPYKAGQRWADPDIEQAAEAMKELALDPDLVKSIGANARQTIKQSFSPAAVGSLIKQRLEEIRKSSGII